MAQNHNNRLSIASKKSFPRHVGIYILLISCLISSRVFSETVVLKSGKSIKGVIKQKTDKSILLDVGVDVPVTYYLDEVKEIISDNVAPEVHLDISDEKQANQLEKEGLNFIEQGQMSDGLVMLRKAIELSPQADRYLNLGSILFGNGVAAFKQGHKDEALSIFQEAQQELKKSIDLFDQATQQMFLAQAYFMLGEMQAQGFANTKEARLMYEKSLSFYPNPAAERALKLLTP